VEEKLKFAVFIDYDNIEIGVRSTLHREFDVDCVLEGLKERGEVVAKVSYGNWARHNTAARAFSEHGVQMVQRDSTPRGDKNGADINLALDALEMAFTRDHINAFAIVSGDSDFMALVNKLKQYNKRVYIVGGKAFTSTILQRNCHEFISYESLLDTPSARRRGGQAAQRPRTRRTLPIAQAVPLIDRALRALEMRGVTRQLGLLKSTMLQLDPAFTERDYGTSSFSTFVEKLVEQGVLAVKTVEGHYVVERKGADAETEPSPGASRWDAIKLLQEVLAANVELLEMGIPAREIRALVQAADANFKETDFGFSEFPELLNLAGDKGLVRIEADPHHGFRYYPGAELPHPVQGGSEARTETPEAQETKTAETASPAAETSRGRGRRRRSRKRTDGPAVVASRVAEADDPEAPLVAEASEAARGSAGLDEESDPDAANEPDDVNGNVASDRPAARRPSRRRRTPRRAPVKAAPIPEPSDTPQP
jgi:uncharacterized protein (TIGR00288 family)